MQEQRKILALGDSYTIGESVAASQRWPNQLADSLKKKGYEFETPKIIARTGWTTEELMRAIEAEKISGNYDYIFLLIGVNNQYRGYSIKEYEKEFSLLLKKSIGFAGGDQDKVFVLSIPDWAYTPFASGRNREQISKEIDAFNEVNKKISLKNKVKYIDVTAISRRGLEEPGLLAGDGLHPSGNMYALWVERIMSTVHGQ
ncbi:MAG: SGNH/GDSL hydrolase family protein [Cytophagaceae bacterium]|nr:SGNH/GDSL hydrolase family protein [Cytophagaceae bacterium]